MNARLKRKQAAIRCRNTEPMRRRLWRQIARRIQAGTLSEAGAARLKREFWERVYEDQQTSKRSS